MDHFRIPFQIWGLFAGCAKIEGIISSNEEALSLEYRVSDTIIGAWSGDITTRRFVWADLERAECGSGFFSPWLVLCADKLSVFDKLPSKTPGQLRLRIPWRHRRQLRALTSEINLLLSYREADRYRQQLSGPAGGEVDRGGGTAGRSSIVDS